MSIYPDKKNGKLTGRWRVELQKGKTRYRKRHNAHADAVKDEQAVLGVWAAGGELENTVRHIEPTKAHCLASLRQAAYGVLWEGDAEPATNWAHIVTVTALVGKDVPLDTIDTLTLDKVLKGLKERGRADGTINRYLSHFRNLLSWGVDRKLMDRTAFNDLKWPWQKESPGRIRWINAAEEAQLKEYLPTNVWMLVKIAIETGCRREELLNIKLHQITPGDDLDVLHLWATKTNDARSVYMTHETSAMLKELLIDKTRPSERGLRSWWDRAKKKMGLEDDPLFVFKACRDTCAARMFERNVPIALINQWLGHKSLETTLRYAHITPESLRQAAPCQKSIEVVSSVNPPLSATCGPLCLPQADRCQDGLLPIAVGGVFPFQWNDLASTLTDGLP